MMNDARLYRCAWPMLLLCALLLLPNLVAAMDDHWVTLTRGKLWANVTASGNESHVRSGDYKFNQAYPGSYESPNMLNGGLPIWFQYLVHPEGKHRGHNQFWGPNDFQMDREHIHMKNYNFVLDPMMPEEYTDGAAHTWDKNVDDDVEPRMWESHFKRAVWSLPEYDDFIIHTWSMKNINTYEWTDAYFGIFKVIDISNGGTGKGFSNDGEYDWVDDLETLGDEQGAFVFYDGTSWPGFGTTPATYTIPPGDQTGDVGDPGNIREANSVDYRLYSPQAYTEAWVECTPNKNGEQKFWYEIRNCGQFPSLNWSHSNAPPEETLKWYTGGYDEYVAWITNNGKGAARMSWAEANAQGLADAGNTWERSPSYIRSVGPYDLAPGDSITATIITCAGALDYTIAMKGGIEATSQLPDAAVEDLKKNWASAMKIYKAAKANGFTNWNEAITVYPPPTPANAPRVGNDDELVVDTYAVAGEGQGYILKWTPVPDSYSDPIKGYNDFVGYKVYKSEIGYEGPWEEIYDLKKDEAHALIDGDQVVFKFGSKPGIPTRFMVRSYDDDGNLSGESAWNYWAVSAPMQPNNNLSKVLVVPNPFKQVSGFLDPSQEKRISFVNVPSQCTIRIYTVAGELVQTLEHDGFGEKPWGSTVESDYMLTRFAMNVAPGIYYYHIESRVAGHEGETATGKFAILK